MGLSLFLSFISKHPYSVDRICCRNVALYCHAGPQLNRSVRTCARAFGPHSFSSRSRAKRLLYDGLHFRLELNPLFKFNVPSKHLPILFCSPLFHLFYTRLSPNVPVQRAHTRYIEYTQSEKRHICHYVNGSTLCRRTY